MINNIPIDIFRSVGVNSLQCLHVLFVKALNCGNDAAADKKKASSILNGKSAIKLSANREILVIFADRGIASDSLVVEEQDAQLHDVVVALVPVGGAHVRSHACGIVEVRGNNLKQNFDFQSQGQFRTDNLLNKSVIARRMEANLTKAD